MKLKSLPTMTSSPTKKHGKTKDFYQALDFLPPSYHLFIFLIFLVKFITHRKARPIYPCLKGNNTWFLQRLILNILHIVGTGVPNGKLICLLISVHATRKDGNMGLLSMALLSPSGTKKRLGLASQHHWSGEDVGSGRENAKLPLPSIIWTLKLIRYSFLSPGLRQRHTLNIKTLKMLSNTRKYAGKYSRKLLLLIIKPLLMPLMYYFDA